MFSWIFSSLFKVGFTNRFFRQLADSDSETSTAGAITDSSDFSSPPPSYIGAEHQVPPELDLETSSSEEALTTPDSDYEADDESYPYPPPPPYAEIDKDEDDGVTDRSRRIGRPSPAQIETLLSQLFEVTRHRDNMLERAERITVYKDEIEQTRTRIDELQQLIDTLVISTVRYGSDHFETISMLYKKKDSYTATLKLWEHRRRQEVPLIPLIEEAEKIIYHIRELLWTGDDL